MDKRILHWSYLNFKEIPMDLYLYEYLEEVYLKENFIAKIPKWLLNLSSLRFIHLAGNQLTKLPEEIYLLESLEFLDVSCNQIDELPPTIGLMLELIQLNVSGNCLTVLPPEIGNLRKLEQLNVAKNQLKRLPLNLSSCSRLIELNLSENPEIWHIPERIASLPSLQQLFADRCGLIYLPVALPKFLTVIRIFHNFAITHIPMGYEKFYQNFYEIRQTSQQPMSVNHPNFFWVQENETNSKLLLPIGTRKVFKIPSIENRISLYDECLHTIESWSRHKAVYDEDALHVILPEKYMVDHIRNGPIARCTNTKCCSPLYTEYYFMVVKRCQSSSRQLFTCYFCTQYCAKYWIGEKWKKYYQVDWEVIETKKAEEEEEDEEAEEEEAEEEEEVEKEEAES